MKLSLLHTRFAVHSAPTQINPDVDTGREDQQRSHESGGDNLAAWPAG